MPLVVIISSQTLFVEGVAGRLRQHLLHHSIQMVDARQPDVLEQVTSQRPAVVIVDATDAEVAQACSIDALLNALPDIKLIRLNPQQEAIQLVTSEQRAVHEVIDLIDAIGLGEHAGAEGQSGADAGR